MKLKERQVPMKEGENATNKSCTLHHDCTMFCELSKEKVATQLESFPGDIKVSCKLWTAQNEKASPKTPAKTRLS
jgi:hypothetical protein